MANFLRQKFMFLLMIGLSACSPFSSPKAPVVLLLLESFSENEYLCSDPKKIEGLVHLKQQCDAFLRFTHVYAPSTLSQPNLTSVLTGSDISQHRVFHNGANGLSSRVQTLAEEAIRYRMRTAFFSGGTPVLHKFGISQGYEVFSDGFQFHSQKFFLPLEETVDSALRWVSEEVQQSSFFLTIYAPDLIHEYQQTKDSLQDDRPISHVSNLKEIYESIDRLIGGLKKLNKWQNSHFVVMGLGGRGQVIDPPNPLSGQALHVPLQIKLARSFNSNLSSLKGGLTAFSQVGRWIKKLIRHRPSQGALSFVEPTGDSWLAHQSHWEKWMGMTNWNPTALRRSQYLFLFNPTVKVFDSFYDKAESEALLDDEATQLVEKFDVNRKLSTFFPDQCLVVKVSDRCPDLSVDNRLLRDIKTIHSWAKQLNQQGVDDDFFQMVLKKSLRRKSEILIHWSAYLVMTQHRWPLLFELGKAVDNKAWMLLAQINLREKVTWKPEGCLSFFIGERIDLAKFYQHCQDSQLRRIVEGLKDLKGRRKPSSSFWAEVARIKQVRKAKQVNLMTLFINDVKDPFDFSPKLSEMFFYLPDHMDYLRLIDFNES